MQGNLNIWNRVLKEHGMKINGGKTQVMTVNNNVKVNITIDGTKLVQVDNFEYLGVMIENTGMQEVEINRRIKNALNVYCAISNGVLNKREVSANAKKNVYKAVFRPILTYGCESWTLTRRQKEKLQTVEMKYLRRTKGVTRMDKIRNTQIREDLNMGSLEEFIEQRQLSWWGHLQRMGEHRQVKKVWEAKIIEKRKRGRPRRTWEKVIGEVLSNKSITWNEAKMKARNKTRMGNICVSVDLVSPHTIFMVEWFMIIYYI